MEILTEQINKIDNYNNLEKVLKVMYTFYNRSTFERLYNESENELKKQNKEHDIKLLHKILDNKRYNYCLELGLNNLNLKDNEQDYNYLSELMENLTDYSKRYEYLTELYNFNEYGTYLPYYLENNFKFNITSEYHIIIDYENKIIFNLSEDNETEILLNLIKENELNLNDSIKLFIIQYENEFNKTIDYNTIETKTIYNLTFENCLNYNPNDNYIIIDNIKDNWKTIFNIDLSETEILNCILENNEQIINNIIENN